MSRLASVNPVTHAVDTMRGLLLDGPVMEPLAWTVGWSLAIAAIFFPLAVRAYLQRR